MRTTTLTALCAVLALSATQAQAADGKATTSNGPFYVGVEAGVVVPEDVNFQGSGSNYSINGKFKFDDGYSVSALAGYKFNDYLRAEAQLGYNSFDYKSISGSATVNGTSYAGSVSMNGDVESWTGMLRGVVAPFGKQTITPLIGAGIGFAATSEKVSRIANQSVNLSDDHTDLALEGMLGFEANVSPQWAVGGRYRYSWVNSGTSYTDDFTAHSFSATASYHF